MNQKCIIEMIKDAIGFLHEVLGQSGSVQISIVLALWRVIDSHAYLLFFFFCLENCAYDTCLYFRHVILAQPFRVN